MKLISELESKKKALYKSSLVLILINLLFFSFSYIAHFMLTEDTHHNLVFTSILCIGYLIYITVGIIVICSFNIKFIIFYLITSLVVFLSELLMLILDYTSKDYKDDYDLTKNVEVVIFIVKIISLIIKIIWMILVLLLINAMTTIRIRESGSIIYNSMGTFISQTENITSRNSEFEDEEKDKVGSLNHGHLSNAILSLHKVSYNDNILIEESYNSKLYSTPPQKQGSSSEEKTIKVNLNLNNKPKSFD